MKVTIVSNLESQISGTPAIVTFTITQKNLNTFFTAIYSHKEENTEWKHFVWNCRLKTAKGEIVIPFKMGLAHVEKKKLKPWQENFKDHPNFAPKPLPPKIEDVLCSLLTDSEALHMSFEDWCGTFGYDSDSIKAFNLYRDCTESGKKLLSIYTRAEIEEIRKELADY